MISIHLRRTGAKKDPHYRVVVSDSREARDGAFIEVLGHYHPRFDPAKVVLDVSKTKAWIEKGAQPSDTVRSLLRRVESGSVEAQPSVAPSRQRAAATQAAVRSAAPVAATEDDAVDAPSADDVSSGEDAAAAAGDAADAKGEEE